MARFLLTLLAGIVLGALAVGATWSTGMLGGEVRVAVQRLEDGRSEVAVQFRQPDGSWGERVLPEQRFAPADAPTGRWLSSSAVPVPAAGAEPLTIGYLGDYTGAVAEFGPVLERAARLAIKHLNQGGGVLGREVRLVIGDTGLDTARSVEQARRMVDVEGVHALVATLATEQVTAVAESVATPNRIPIISPTATAVALANADDDDFLFRTTISDAAQGAVLAQLAADEGYTNVGVLYIDDPYGQGLSETFLDDWGDVGTGFSIAVPIQGDESSYREQLARLAGAGADVLVAIAYPSNAAIFVTEALDNELFDRFLFVDATRSLELLEAAGAERLDGMKGTAPASDPDSASLAAFNAAWQAEYGELPSLAFAHETYDAVITLALAAVAAGSTDGAAMRDQLREVACEGGTIVNAGPAGVAAALRALRNGEAINYEGAAGTLDWDDKGDIENGPTSASGATPTAISKSSARSPSNFPTHTTNQSSRPLLSRRDVAPRPCRPSPPSDL